MIVAIVHDYIKEYGGAERVLEALHEIWPDAPVYTFVYLPGFLGPHKDRFSPSASSGWNIKTSWLQYLPFKAKLISPIRLIAPWIFGQFDFSKFDVVIVSSTGAYVKNIASGKWQIADGKNNHKPNATSHKPVVVTYCHTPPRYLYGYATARDWKSNIVLRVLGAITNHFLRLIDFKSAQNVDYFIANSENIASRIEKFYRRGSTVIYPPVSIDSSMYQVLSSKYKENIHNTNYKLRNTYYLAGGRIAKAKHTDLIIKTFEKSGLPLKVFGRSFAGNGIESNKSNIEFVGEVSDEEKMKLMAGAKAFVFAAEDEDFGITPVEAMSVGTPVIAYRSGGVVESIVHGRTGLFFNELTVESLSLAIKQFNNLTINPKDCIKSAQKFSKERFKKEILEFVNSKFKR